MKTLLKNDRHLQLTLIFFCRHDVLNGELKIVNCFTTFEETIFAVKGEFFGEIELSQFLVMDEISGHLISRSVESLIVRPAHKTSRVYECCIKTKNPQSVIIKLNKVFCEDYSVEYDQVMNVDIKFIFNRRGMCEMHQAIDFCKEKMNFLIPDFSYDSREYKVCFYSAKKITRKN